ncbi:MAG: pyrroline-5-carboxylate reductase [Treponema sp.]|jgi:pyrroline-5-carboxylate reductase|nr:pyrroline-5-carboxylate reductase [Treponema sp.]
MDSTIACIGSGNMGTALMKGAAEIAGGGRIGFCDTDRAKAAAAAKELGAAIYASAAEAAAKGDYVFLAVKPQALGSLLGEIAPVLGERLAAGKPPVLVSMAAGWPIGKIQALAGSGPAGRIPTARIMPNTPALIRRGMIALAVSPELEAAQTGELEKILGAAGLVDRVDEAYLDAVTGLSGSGPAFVYLFIEALADGGVRAGLPRDKSLRYAARTVLGAAAMVEETGKHPGELKDMVTSPGGTTIAGIAALERGAFRGTVMNAVEAAWKRSIELGAPAPR